MKDWLDKLNDPSRDVYERRYRLLSAASIFMLALWLVVVFLESGLSQRFLFFATIDLLFIPTMLLTLRTGRVQVGAGLSGIVLVFLMLPYAFINNGGIHAGAPNWCIISMVFITLTVRGKLRAFLLVSDILMTTACYVYLWLNPDAVVEYSEASAYVDSLASLIITGVLISIMFLFQIHMAHQERAILEKQRREILELVQAQNRFFSSMSHEIRTPVNTIVGLNEMILREDVSPEVAEDAGQVRAAGRLLLHLINDILDLSRLESGQMALNNDVYSPGDLLSDVVGMMWVHAQAKGLEFHVDVDPRLPASLYGDEIRIKQILINVLNNAVKYTRKGSVTLTVLWKPVEEGGPAAVFQVSDTGQGIRKENLAGLFSAFKRVDGAETRGVEGTGLGLSIVKQLVDRMGGRVTVDSVYTRGSTFTIELPQEETGAGPIGDLQLEGRQAGGARARYSRRFEAPEARVLVVDDNAANRMVVCKLLRDTRMQIDEASSGEEALQKTLKCAYHLIFMDHVMPGMDGVTALSRLRSQAGGLSKEARVVALTANADGDSKSYYRQKGFDAYVLKPCTGDELEKVCIRLLPPELVRLMGDGEIIENSVTWMTEPGRKETLVVTTDSVACLPEWSARRNGVGVIPYGVETKEGRFRDGLEIESYGLSSYLTEDGGDARAVPPTVADYEAFFAGQLARADHVVHVAASGRLPWSGCANARQAAQSFTNVTVVDSGLLDGALGLMVLEAVRLAGEGLPPARIPEALKAARSGIHVSFIVENLKYLEKTGLVKSRAARIAEALLVRPVLTLRDGEFRMKRIFLGGRESAWRRYIACELEHLPAGGVLIVSYVDLSQSALNLIREEIERHGGIARVHFHKTSPAIAVNCGPGTLGLIAGSARSQ